MSTHSGEDLVRTLTSSIGGNERRGKVMSQRPSCSWVVRRTVSRISKPPMNVGGFDVLRLQHEYGGLRNGVTSVTAAGAATSEEQQDRCSIEA